MLAVTRKKIDHQFQRTKSSPFKLFASYAEGG